MMKKLGTVIGLVLVFAGFSFGAGGVLPGAGTEGSPYLIEDRADFDAYCADPSYWTNGVYTRLEVDLDLSDTNYVHAIIAPDSDGWDAGGSPTIYDGTLFQGVFDGNYHAISNCIISGQSNSDYLALFGRVSGQILNLSITGGRVSGCCDDDYGSYFTASLCAYNSGVISNCFSSSEVSNDGKYIGGLCGYNSGKIIECYATGHIGGASPSVAGGLCGYNDGIISRCYATGNVKGGFLAYSGTNYYWAVDGDTLGGLCGVCSGSIVDSFATGSVQGGSDPLSGLCAVFSDRTISNCYATGGCLIAYRSGSSPGVVENSFYPFGYWSAGGTERSLTQMQSQVNYIAAGWDFAGESANGTNDVWFMDEYPVLILSADQDADGIKDFWELEYFGTLDRDGSGDYDGDALSDAAEINSRLNPLLVDTDGDGVEDGTETGLGSDPLVYNFPETGTESDPYLISNRASFDAFCADSTFWATGVYARLETDLDLSGTTYPRSPVAPDTSTDSGFQGTSYSGNFDGNGHAIRNLVVDTFGDNHSYLGLFGRVDEAEIKELTLNSFDIDTGTGVGYIGVLCGYATNATMRNCHVSGVLLGANNCDNMGGLCGYLNYGTIENCSFSGTVCGSDFLGGVCGYNNYGTIRDCSVDATVMGTDSDWSSGDYGSDYVGGLCGYNNQGQILSCGASVTVSGDENIGGLCARNEYGSIIESFADADITGTDNVGGFCGYISYASHVTNCYSSGSVSGTDDVGGFVGESEWGLDIVNSYSSAAVSGDTDVGGFCGAFGGATVVACFWDVNASSQSNSVLGAGKTTLEMQTESTFTDSGWDFVEEANNGTNDIWAMNGYPVLAWQLPSLPPVYELVVTNGSGDGSYMEDTEIAVTADDTAAGFRFDGWAASPSQYTNRLDDSSASSTTFTMPGTNVTLRATYFQWDSDLDGLDDGWEQQIIDADSSDDIDTLAEVRPDDDFDGDGVSNGDESSLGRDPVVIEARISNLLVAQRPGSKTVDVTYDLISGKTNALPISLLVSNGVMTVSALTVTGDVGSVVSTGTLRAVEWNAGADWNTNQAELGFTVKVVGVSFAEQRVAETIDTRDYTLTVSADHGEPIPSVGVHSNYCWQSSVTCSVEAVASDSWMFMGWTGDATTPYTQTNVTVLMDTLFKAVTAQFSDDADGDGLVNSNEWAIGSNPRMKDTDGDGFDDAFEVGKGLSPTNDDCDVATYICDHDDTFGLYSSNVVLDVAVGQMLLGISGSNALLQLQLEQSDDLQRWTNAGEAVEWSLPVGEDKKFFRIHASD
jgi:hypothetical protein